MSLPAENCRVCVVPHTSREFFSQTFSDFGPDVVSPLHQRQDATGVKTLTSFYPSIMLTSFPFFYETKAKPHILEVTLSLTNFVLADSLEGGKKRKI